jgi:hypothetical protein
MTSKKNYHKNEDEIRKENALLRSKIELLTGKMLGPGIMTRDLSPLIENHFLHHILRVEESMHHSKEVSVYTRLGKPKIIKEQKLEDGDLTNAISKLQELLSDKGIIVDSICEVDDREFYRFLTVDLMKQRVPAVCTPGMMICFTYEEFYPNDEYDIKELVEGFLKALEENSFNEYPVPGTYFNIKTFEEIKLFRNAFCRFEIVQEDLINQDITEKDAIIKLWILAFGTVSPGMEPIKYEGEATFKLHHEFYWEIKEVEFPGM